MTKLAVVRNKRGEFVTAYELEGEVVPLTVEQEGEELKTEVVEVPPNYLFNLEEFIKELSKG